MNVEFTTSKLLVEFEEGEPFAGRDLVIKGEALAWGFEGFISTMVWLAPYEDEVITTTEQELIIKLLKEENKRSKTGFEIILLDDDRKHV